MEMEMCRKVKPGELVRADDHNCLVDACNALLVRVIKLEEYIAKGTKLVITDIVPKGPLPLGAEVRISGRNFAFPSVMNRVTLGGVPILVFNPGSNDSLLIFNIPLNISGVPKPAELVITAGEESDSIVVDLVAAGQTKPTGVVVFSEDAGNGSLGRITEGNTYTWMFLIDSQTNIAEDYQVSVSFTESSGVSNSTWLGAATLVNRDGAPLNATTITERINPASAMRVGIQLRIPSGATAVKMNLRARSVNNDAELSRTYTVPIAVGQETATSDPRVTFATMPFGGASRGRIAQDGAVEIPFGGNAQVRVLASFRDDPVTGARVEGTFAYDVKIEDAPAGTWTAGELGVGSGSAGRASGQTETLTTRLTLNTASDPGGQAEKGTLVITATRTSGEPFTSFTRIPIRGYTFAG
jgi:hypothetical protein